MEAKQRFIWWPKWVNLRDIVSAGKEWSSKEIQSIPHIMSDDSIFFHWTAVVDVANLRAARGNWGFKKGFVARDHFSYFVVCLRQGKREVEVFDKFRKPHAARAVVAHNRNSLERRTRAEPQEKRSRSFESHGSLIPIGTETGWWSFFALLSYLWLQRLWRVSFT